MHSSLLERCRVLREHIEAPPFPLAAIRAATERAVQPTPRRRSIAAVVLASLSIVSIAAAAEMLQQTHVYFVPSSGMVISSDAKVASRPIHTNAEILKAAEHLDFPAILPKGLPIGSKPIRLFMAGRSMLAITYDLPGAQRRSHHMLWIFIANRATMTGSNSSAPALYKIRPGKLMWLRFWRVGQEAVIAASNGSTDQELAAIKRAMEQEATR